MKKAFVAISILVCLVASFAIVNGATSSSKVKLAVSLNSIVCIKNDSVGNEWSFSCTANKTVLKKGATIKFESATNSNIIITAKAVESDTYPDVGTNSLTIPVSQLKQGNNAYSLQVTVKENRGRYSGHTAIWKFSFSINTSTIDNQPKTDDQPTANNQPTVNNQPEAINQPTTDNHPTTGNQPTTSNSEISTISQDKIRNGTDTYTWDDGTSYNGGWKDNMLNGIGTLTYANGDKYFGSFVNNMKNGFGTYSWVNGDRYSGNWKDDIMSGSGTYNFTNGDMYVGNWDAGYMNGNGTYYFKGGTMLTGIWVDNQYSSED